MRNEVLHFFTPGVESEIWGWCAGYDWVAFCQLFGTMMDLPAGWPHYMRDVQYLLDEAGISDDAFSALVRPAGNTHNALDDARYIRDIWRFSRTPKWVTKGPVSIQGSVERTMIITGDGNVLRSDRERK